MTLKGSREEPFPFVELWSSCTPQLIVGDREDAVGEDGNFGPWGPAMALKTPATVGPIGLPCIAERPLSDEEPETSVTHDPDAQAHGNNRARFLVGANGPSRVSIRPGHTVPFQVDNACEGLAAWSCGCRSWGRREAAR